MMLDFCLSFPRCINELLKRVTGTSYRRYVTNPVALYYVQPTLGDVDINFCDLAKLPKPLSGCLSKKQLDEIRHCGYSSTSRVSDRIPQGTFHQKTTQAPCHWTSTSLNLRSNIQLTLTCFSMKTFPFNTKILAQYVTLSSPSLRML